MKRFVTKPQKTPEELKTHSSSCEDGGAKISEWTVDQFVGGNPDRQGATTPKAKAPKMTYMNYRQKKESVLFTSQQIVDFLRENNKDNAWYVNTKMPGAPVGHKFLSPLAIRAHVAEAVKKMKDEDARDYVYKAKKHAEAGKSTFTIGGETHPVTAKKMHESGRTDVEGMNADEADKGPGKGGGFTNKTPLAPVKWPAPAHGGPAKMPKHKDSLDEEKEEEPPFEGGHTRKTHDKYGNPIKQKNVAKHLARRMMKKMAQKEEVEQIDEVTPPGREKQVKALKKVKGITNPWAVAWASYNKSHKKEEVELEEDSDKERDHTHAAHFHDAKGNWSGMALIHAKSDEDAIAQAHDLSKTDRYKNFKLAHVEKHVPVKDLDESIDDESADGPGKRVWKNEYGETEKQFKDRHAHANQMGRIRREKEKMKKEEVEQNESVGTNMSASRNRYDVVVKNPEGKEVKVHKNVGGVNDKHAITHILHKYPEGHKATATQVEEGVRAFESLDDTLSKIRNQSAASRARTSALTNKPKPTPPTGFGSRTHHDDFLRRQAERGKIEKKEVEHVEEGHVKALDSDTYSGKTTSGKKWKLDVPGQSHELTTAHVRTQNSHLSPEESKEVAHHARHYYRNVDHGTTYKYQKEEVEQVEEGKHASTIAAIAAQAYNPKVGDKIRTRMGGQIPGEVTKVTNTHVHFTHPEGKTYKTHISNVRLDEEVEQVDENNDSHTHAAHFKNSKGEWAGMALIDAKDDKDAVKKAHQISAGDKWKDFQLDSVEKHVPVKENVVENEEDLNEILESLSLDEAKKTREEKKAEARQKAFHIIHSGKGSESLRRKLAKMHGIEYHGSSGAKVKSSKAAKPEAEKPVGQQFKRRPPLSPEVAKLRALNAAKAASARHATSGVGGGGTGPKNVSPLDVAMTKMSEKPKKGAGATPHEIKAAKNLSEKKDVNQPDDVELKKVMGGHKESGKPLSEAAKKLKRKYMGKKLGRTATGKPANKIETETEIADSNVKV